MSARASNDRKGKIENDSRAIHFGRNPRRGGSPPKDIKITISEKFEMLDNGERDSSCRREERCRE